MHSSPHLRNRFSLFLFIVKIRIYMKRNDLSFLHPHLPRRAVWDWPVRSWPLGYSGSDPKFLALKPTIELALNCFFQLSHPFYNLIHLAHPQWLSKGLFTGLHIFLIISSHQRFISFGSKSCRLISLLKTSQSPWLLLSRVGSNCRRTTHCDSDSLQLAQKW